MLETTLAAAVGWLLLAAQSHRFRREVGGMDRRAILSLRTAALVAFIVAWTCAEAALPGERWVRLTGGASLSALAVTGLLSFAPSILMRPIRATLMLFRRDPARQTDADRVGAVAA